MKRPYIICHMVISIDGKATGDFLFTPDCEKATEEYYRINREYNADAFACGRITMEDSFTGGFQPDLTPFADADIPTVDHIADNAADFYAVSFDRRGRVGWTGPRIVDEDPGYGNSHIIEVLCEGVSPEYLAYLRHIGVSYIFAGSGELDISLALEKLYTKFGIKKLLLEGGSVINGAFQREGAVDELSLVVAPIVAGTDSKPLFWESEISCFSLVDMKKLDGGAVWLNYKK